LTCGDDRLLWRDGANPNLPPITLQHVGWRWYQPEIGRFVQRDPIGIAGGQNVYVYLQCRPTDAADPFGQKRYKVIEAVVTTQFRRIQYGEGGRPVAIHLTTIQAVRVATWDDNVVQRTAWNATSATFGAIGIALAFCNPILGAGVYVAGAALGVISIGMVFVDLPDYLVERHWEVSVTTETILLNSHIPP